MVSPVSSTRYDTHLVSKRKGRATWDDLVLSPPKVGAKHLETSDFVLFAERDKSRPMSYSSLH